MKSSVPFIVCVLMTTCCGQLLADAEGDFETLFGQEARNVLESKDTEDDAVFAGKLLNAAEAMVDALDLQALLYQKAHEFGARDPSGCTTALQALRLLEKRFPDRRPEWEAKRLGVHRRRYEGSRGEEKQKAAKPYAQALIREAVRRVQGGKVDEARALYTEAHKIAVRIKWYRATEIQDRIDGLAELLVQERKLRALHDALTKTPSDTEVRVRLILFYVAEMNSPDRASELLTEEVSVAFRANVLLAAKPMDELSEADCLRLGEWYVGLAEDVSVQGKLRCLSRAERYLNYFLELHTKKDAVGYKGQLLLEKIGKERGRMWINLIAGVNVKEHAVKGKWGKAGMSLTRMVGTYKADTPGFGRTMLPASPRGSYELRAVFARIEGQGRVQFILPVGESQVCLALDRGIRDGGRAYGLEHVEEQGVDRNPTSVRAGGLVNGREYSVLVRVVIQDEDAVVTAHLDGHKVVHWRGKQTSLSVHESYRLPDPHCLGLAVGSQSYFRKIELRETISEETPPSKVLPGDPLVQPSHSEPGKAVDLLGLVVPKKHTVSGIWVRQGSSIRTDKLAGSLGKAHKIMMPVIPRGSYEIRVKFARHDGKGAIAVVLPVGQTGIALILSHAGGEVHGLGHLGGKVANKNETTVRPGKLANGMEHVLHARVKLDGSNAEIHAELDGKVIIRWRGPQSSLKVPPDKAMRDRRCPGLLAGSPTTFRLAGLRMLDGTVEKLK